MTFEIHQKTIKDPKCLVVHVHTLNLSYILLKYYYDKIFGELLP